MGRLEELPPVISVTSHMERALELAKQGVGTTSPNPSVGAVIVREGRVVGEGHTQPPGSAHAEIVALRQASEAACGATLYVTLEPCCHHGRTPPCSDAIIKAGVAEVHLATIDPNPIVSGKGKAALEAAGIRVLIGEREQEAREAIESHAKYITTGTPFVAVKYAMSLDGKLATRTGDSKWISGEASRAYVQELRRQADAIAVGIGTALADNPRLTVRDAAGRPAKRQPFRVVIDSQGRLPTSAVLLTEPGKALVATARASTRARAALERAGAEVVSLPGPDDQVDLKALLRLLGQREITSLLVEGGSALLGSFFQQGLVDKVYAFVAPVIIGGEGAPSPVGGAGVEHMAQALRLHRVRTTQLGEDTLVVGYTRPAEGQGH